MTTSEERTVTVLDFQCFMFFKNPPGLDINRSPPVVTVVPPVVTDCSTDGTRMMQVQQKSAEV